MTFFKTDSHALIYELVTLCCFSKKTLYILISNDIEVHQYFELPVKIKRRC